MTAFRGCRAAASAFPFPLLFLLAGRFSAPLGAEAVPLAGSTPGVAIEEVERWSLGDQAGLRAGDVVTGWSRAPSFPANPIPASGPLASPFELQEILIEQAPRGALTLRGRRNGETRSWTLIAGASIERTGLTARPLFAPERLSRYREATAGWKAARKARDASGSLAWDEAIALASSQGAASDALWLRQRRAELALDLGRPEATVLARRTAALLLAGGQVVAATELYRQTARRLAEDADWPELQRVWGQAQAVLDRYPSFELMRARTLAAMGESARVQVHLDEAQARLLPALAGQTAQAPASLDAAQTLHELGRAVNISGDAARARGYLEQAEALARVLDPKGLQHARFLDSLSSLLFNQGDVVEGEALALRALRIAERAQPVGYDTGRILIHLGVLTASHTDLTRAEEILRRAVAVWEALPPTFLNRYNHANALAQLGSVLNEAGDSVAAERFGRQALAMQETLGPGSGNLVTHSLELLAMTLTELDRLDEARELIRRALDLHRQHGSNGPYLAQSFRILGSIELADGHAPDAAEAAYSEAEGLYRTAHAGGLFLGYSLEGKGQAQGERGHRKQAIATLDQALALYRQVAPGGTNEVYTLHLLGLQKRSLGRKKEAAADFCQAAGLLDKLRGRVGRDAEGSSPYLASRASFYTDCIDALVALGRPEAAFQVLESGRARGLLDLIAQRDLSLDDLSEELRTERARLRDRYDTLYAALSSSQTAGDPQKGQALRGELEGVRGQLDALSLRIRKESPRYASLHEPAPLGLAQARRALDPGTVLLAYSIGEERSSLFVVRAAGAPGPGVQVLPLAISARSLRRAVAELTRLLADGTGSPESIKGRAGALYRLLVAPAERAVAGAQRLLIAPDGPLHGLPFGALVRPDGRYLIEGKPIHTIVSATVYAEVRKARKGGGAPRSLRTVQVAAFGDPQYPEAPETASSQPVVADDLTVRSALRRGLTLAPLPGTRSEVEALGQLYSNSKIYVGAEATEERAKALGREPKIVHFAGHALLDERLPLNSALALTIPEHPVAGQENGLLQAWEIFDQVRLDADLVTLSACNTGLGEEVSGEGLIGLTRAFQFAGARTVLASLWAIGDSATARFMPRFYQHLRNGLTKDEALQQTQIEWIHDPATTHPFNWAAFQLVGDYR